MQVDDFEVERLAQELAQLNATTPQEAILTALQAAVRRTPAAEKATTFAMNQIVRKSCLTSYGSLYVIGYRAKHLTFLSQQVRALNLVYALDRLGILRMGYKIAVVGAGAAGVTAGCAAALLGYCVYIFDSYQKILAPQRGCTTRLLHPNIYDWPEYSAEAETAPLPILYWNADIAGKVVKQLDQQWQSFKNVCKDRIEERLGYQINNIQKSDVSSKLVLHAKKWQRCSTRV